MLQDGYCQYTWDGEERLSSATCAGTTTTYIYDAEGRRVAKAVNGTITQEYVYNLAGQAVSTYGPYPTMTWLRDDIWMGSRHLATYANGTTYFNHADGLGTERARTAVNGSVYETCTSLPFGDGQSCTAADPTPSHFTGLPRDTETGNDSAMFRYFDSAQGRWMSPDPLGGDISNSSGDEPGGPQSLNRYAYVINNPTNVSDPTGMNCQQTGTCAQSGLPHPVSCATMTCAWQYYSGTLLGSYGNNLGGIDVSETVCEQDGVLTNCGSIGWGGVQECPNDVCSGVGADQFGNSHFVEFHAFAGAAGAVDGYYATWGVGSLSYTWQGAGIQASHWGSWFEKQTGSESGGTLWCAYGVCSSSLLAIGKQGAGGVTIDNFGYYPAQTQLAGWWVGSAGEIPAHDKGIAAYYNQSAGTDLPYVRGTPNSDVDRVRA